MCPDSIQPLSRFAAFAVSIRSTVLSRFDPLFFASTRPESDLNQISGLRPSCAGAWLLHRESDTKNRRQEDRPLPPPVLRATAFALCLKVCEKNISLLVASRTGSRWRRGRRSVPHAFPTVTRTALLPVATLLSMVGAEGLHLLPLLGGQFGPDGKQVARVRLFQLCPRLRHLIDLGQNLAFIRLVVADQRLHRQFRFLHIASQIDESLPMFQQRCIERLLLLVGQLQLLGDFRIVPPPAVNARAAKCPLERWPMLTDRKSVA